MADRLSRARGCLLGLAVGDAMGAPVDQKSLYAICTDYGPNGLLGYDLANGTADVSSYTQVAAFVSNGLLLSVSRGRTDHLPCITLSLREWARNQQFYRDPEKSYCWVAKPKSLRAHNNRDARMLDTLRAQTLGTFYEPINHNATPGALTAAVAVGNFYDSRNMTLSQIATLGARTVALTHGDPEAFICGAIVSHIIAALSQSAQAPLLQVFSDAISAAQALFGEKFPYAAESVAERLNQALTLAQDTQTDTRSAMESLSGRFCASVLSGAFYACLTSADDFDTALITAVNHSGLSAAVGALTGAIMGAYLGAEALPEFYLESLTPVQELSELSSDIALRSLTTGLFDDDWDHKYMQGLPLGQPL